MITLLSHRLRQLSFSTQLQRDVLEDFSALIEDGIPASQAVDILVNVTTGTTAEVLEEIRKRIGQGRRISDGMAGWFPPHIVEIVRAGEEGGTLGQTLAIAAKTLSQRKDILSSLFSSLSYPLVVILMGLGVTVFLKDSILANFEAIKPVSQWPANGQFIYGLASFIQEWWWATFLALIGAIIFIAWGLRMYIGPLRSTLDEIPLISLYRKMTAARFMEILGLLISNGVVFKRALHIIQSNAPDYLASHLLAMEHRLGGGQANIADVLDTGLIDNSDMARLRAIALSKGFEHALVRQGQRATEQGIQAVQVFGRITGGILLAMGAMLAAVLVLGLYAVGSSLAG
ncbi:MAG: type II secretion system F family protein [Gammaproteobacteria bacterium]